MFAGAKGPVLLVFLGVAWCLLASASSAAPARHQDILDLQKNGGLFKKNGGLKMEDKAGCRDKRMLLGEVYKMALKLEEDFDFDKTVAAPLCPQYFTSGEKLVMAVGGFATGKTTALDSILEKTTGGRVLNYPRAFVATEAMHGNGTGCTMSTVRQGFNHLAHTVPSFCGFTKYGAFLSDAARSCTDVVGIDDVDFAPMKDLVLVDSPGFIDWNNGAAGMAERAHSHMVWRAMLLRADQILLFFDAGIMDPLWAAPGDSEMAHALRLAGAFPEKVVAMVNKAATNPCRSGKGRNGRSTAGSGREHCGKGVSRWDLKDDYSGFVDAEEPLPTRKGLELVTAVRRVLQEHVFRGDRGQHQGGFAQQLFFTNWGRNCSTQLCKPGDPFCRTENCWGDDETTPLPDSGCVSPCVHAEGSCSCEAIARDERRVMEIISDRNASTLETLRASSLLTRLKLLDLHLRVLQELQAKACRKNWWGSEDCSWRNLVVDLESGYFLDEVDLEFRKVVDQAVREVALSLGQVEKVWDPEAGNWKLRLRGILYAYDSHAVARHFLRNEKRFGQLPKISSADLTGHLWMVKKLQALATKIDLFPGCGAKEQKAATASAKELKLANFTAKELKAAGFKAEKLEEARTLKAEKQDAERHLLNEAQLLEKLKEQDREMARLAGA